MDQLWQNNLHTSRCWTKAPMISHHWLLGDVKTPGRPYIAYPWIKQITPRRKIVYTLIQWYLWIVSPICEDEWIVLLCCHKCSLPPFKLEGWAIIGQQSHERNSKKEDVDYSPARDLWKIEMASIKEKNVYTLSYSKLTYNHLYWQVCFPILSMFLINK